MLKKLEKANKAMKNNKRGALAEVQKSKALDKAIDKAYDLKQKGYLDWGSIKMLEEDVTQDIIDKGDAKLRLSKIYL